MITLGAILERTEGIPCFAQPEETPSELWSAPKLPSGQQPLRGW